MPEYLAPGVYVEERDTGSKPIEGVSTSTAGMLGVTERGPVNVPILITSSADYGRWFGGLLNRSDYSNANGAHCYLPHAVDGFFRNGGKRLFVTRVLDCTGAGIARCDLFNRGDATAADTLIVRAVDEGSGSAANGPGLSVLDVSDLSDGDWIRIGEGSKAEYRQIDRVGATADSTHVPLNMPLNLSHAVGTNIRQLGRTPDAVYGAAFALHEEARIGARTLVLQGATAADITLLVTAAANFFIEIGGLNGEYHQVQSVTRIGADQARLTLFTRLAMNHAVSTAVTPLDITAVDDTQPLSLAVVAGARLLFLDDLNGNYTSRSKLVLIDDSQTQQRELRRIGDLHGLTLASAAVQTYGAGTLLESVRLADTAYSVDASGVGGTFAAGATQIVLSNVGRLVAGQRLLLSANNPAQQETVTIRAIDTATGTITLTSATTQPHDDADTALPAPKSLTAAAAAASAVIAIDNRLGLAEGDVLRVGQHPNEEYVVIAAINNTSGTAPDAGNVVLEQPLASAHAAGTPVQRQTQTGGSHQPTVLALDAGESATILVVTDGAGYAADDFVRLTTGTSETFYHRLTDADDLTPAEVVLTEVLERGHPAGSLLVGRDALLEIHALDAGHWGNRLRIAVEDEEVGLVAQTAIERIVNPSTIELTSLAGIEPGTVLELRNPTDGSRVGDPVKVTAVDRSDGSATLAAALSAVQQNTFAAEGALRAGSREFRLSVFLLRQPDPAMPSRNDTVIASEIFRHLSMDHRHSRYVHRIIGTTWMAGSAEDGDGNPLRKADRRSEGGSNFIRVRDTAANATQREAVRLGPEALIDALPNGRRAAARHALRGGDDAMATLTDNTYIGTDSREPEQRTGMYTFRNEEEISLVAIPGVTRARVQEALINHCENERYRFAVLDADVPPSDSLNDVQAQRQNYDTKYAALYHPWLLIPDPHPVNLAKVADYAIPPSGHVLGIYARTDTERGVHKAPANEVVRGISGLRRTLNKGEHDILNPKNINVIRDFRPNNRGLRVWGARVMTSDPDWKYVNVRRLLIFIEHSLERGLQWVVFEPNADPLWARVRRTISNFLTTVWRNGALEGTKVEEAFYVKCDRTTMTQTDIDNGRLIVEIGVAPVKPAEFVIVRIGLWTAHAGE